MTESIGHLRKAGAVLSLALILAACSSDGDSGASAESGSQQNHPTATQLAESEGGSVSEFPRYERGLSENIRYCLGNGGEVLWVSDAPNQEAVGCKIADVGFVSHLNRRDDSGLEEMCAQASGEVVGVAIEIGSDFNVPACHIQGQTEPS